MSVGLDLARTCGWSALWPEGACPRLANDEEFRARSSRVLGRHQPSSTQHIHPRVRGRQAGRRAVQSRCAWSTAATASLVRRTAAGPRPGAAFHLQPSPSALDGRPSSGGHPHINPGNRCWTRHRSFPITCTCRPSRADQERGRRDHRADFRTLYPRPPPWAPPTTVAGRSPTRAWMGRHLPVTALACVTVALLTDPPLRSPAPSRWPVFGAMSGCRPLVGRERLPPYSCPRRYDGRPSPLGKGPSPPTTGIPLRGRSPSAHAGSPRHTRKSDRAGDIGRQRPTANPPRATVPFPARHPGSPPGSPPHGQPSCRAARIHGRRRRPRRRPAAPPADAPRALRSDRER